MRLMNTFCSRNLIHLFVLHAMEHILTTKKKAKIVEHLERKGIETRPLLSFIPEQPPYQKYQHNMKDLKVASEAHKSGFYISNAPSLTQIELEHIAAALAEEVEHA